MSAPPQGFGSGGGGLSPATFLGTYSGSNPSAPANGYWWYRIDLGEIWANMNVAGLNPPPPEPKP
jgi:hypothetical protein